MKIEYETKQKPTTSTTTKPTPWKLTLTAEGSYKEIAWLKARLAEIGKK